MPHDEQQILNADHALATLASTFGTSSTNPADNYSLPPIDDDRAMVSHVRRELKRELKEATSLTLVFVYCNTSNSSSVLPDSASLFMCII
jgi:hypothetical protein